MQELDLTARIVGLLKQYMFDPMAPVASCTILSDLKIDLLDLPMIILDVEDAFNIHICYDEEVEKFTTVGDLVACVTSHLEAKAAPRSLMSIARTRRPWTCTGAPRG
jgi:acyl carrier protein